MFCSCPLFCLSQQFSACVCTCFYTKNPSGLSVCKTQLYMYNIYLMLSVSVFVWGGGGSSLLIHPVNPMVNHVH